MSQPGKKGGGKGPPKDKTEEAKDGAIKAGEFDAKFTAYLVNQ